MSSQLIQDPSDTIQRQMAQTNRLVDAACAHCGMTRAELLRTGHKGHASKTQRAVKVRSLAIQLLRGAGFSHPAIGRVLSIHHSTSVTAFQRCGQVPLRLDELNHAEERV